MKAKKVREFQRDAVTVVTINLMAIVAELFGMSDSMHGAMASILLVLCHRGVPDAARKHSGNR